MREAKPSDFNVSVPGVGDFIFARRTLGDGLAIRANLRRLIGNCQFDTDDELYSLANMTATIKVLCVDAPNGWDDPESKDSFNNPGAYDTIIDIWNALKEAEDSFREKTPRESASVGKDAGGESGVPVSPTLQLATKQPAATVADV